LSARSPAAAVEEFLTPVRRALSCIVREHATLRGGFDPKSAISVVTLNKYKAQPARLYHPSRSLGLFASLQYRHTQSDGGIWRAEPAGYLFEVVDRDEQTVLAYHWHPFSRVRRPHLHVGSQSLVKGSILVKAHFPTPELSYPSLVRSVIEELGIVHIREDWAEVLDAAERAIEELLR
jgi:hypothetical protein